MTVFESIYHNDFKTKPPVEYIYSRDMAFQNSKSYFERDYFGDSA